MRRRQYGVRGGDESGLDANDAVVGNAVGDAKAATPRTAQDRGRYRARTGTATMEQ
jgi:hypothetical protein